MRHFLNSTALASRATFNTEPVIINTGGGNADETPALIDQVVEARVEAALATEAAEEAGEVAEAATAQVESLEQWQQMQASRLSELEERFHLLPTREELTSQLAAMAEAQQSSILDLIQQQLSESREPSLLTAETETLTEAAAEAIAENPELGAVMIATDTSETATEPSSETATGAPGESEGGSVVVAVSSEAVADQRPRLRARLV